MPFAHPLPGMWRELADSLVEVVRNDDVDTPFNINFESMGSKQVGWADKTPYHPGIGVSAASSHFGANPSNRGRDPAR
ncbi:MAG: hypothetical protein WCS65_00865 [Verrucomicrobiae bacterium]